MYLNSTLQINEDGDASLHYWIGAFANEVLIADSNSLRNKNEDLGLQTFQLSSNSSCKETFNLLSFS